MLKQWFWTIMTWLDDHVNHRFMDLFSRFGNNDNFLLDITARFCIWSYSGYFEAFFPEEVDYK